jgi:2-succinyl-5-enolpyruvyl-6-hydroxy-3-cyclohexene-1-carboxylate synthase
MIPVNRTYAPIQVLVDELVRCGMRHAVTCPGSRNAPIALTLAAEERLESWSVLDERSAGFFALGLAKSTGRPVAVTTTSGSATANLLPAVVEARESRLPLIVLSADRPPELRDVGAGQAIDQVGIFGSAAEWFVEGGSHEPGRETAVHFRALACRAWATAIGGRPGVVHLNLPLREPLAPSPEDLDPSVWEGRPDGRPWVSVERPAAAGGQAIAALAREVASSPRGALVCGPTTELGLPDAAVALARAAGWPLLAEPTSGTRCGAHDRSHVIAHYDALLRSDAFAAAHRPDLVLRVGDTPTSKALRAWLAGAERQVVADPDVAWHEPTRQADRLVAAPGGTLCRALAEALGESSNAVDPGWLDSWRRADALVPAALDEAPDPFEPRALAALAEVAEPGSTVWIGSSMPIRDVETFFPSVATPIRFLANRGANGIDGTVSSALGAAAADRTSRTYLLIGELSLLHDIGGLLLGARHGIELTIVCLNNGGGGIFDFLPVAAHADRVRFEAHIATPHEVDLAQVAALAGMAHTLASTVEEVRAAIARPGLVEVRANRRENVDRHREVLAAVSRRLEDTLVS